MAKETKAKAAAKGKVDVSTPEPVVVLPTHPTHIHEKEVVLCEVGETTVKVVDVEGTGYTLPKSEYVVWCRQSGIEVSI